MSIQPSVTANPREPEILRVRPGIPHAIVGGLGEIEHLGIRVPALDDKQITGEISKINLQKYENGRSLSGEWGYRIPLDSQQHKNCWLIGAGSALYESQHMVCAYLDFPPMETAYAGIGTRHQLHLHQKSWEYYAVLQGEITLQIEDKQVAIQIAHKHHIKDLLFEFRSSLTIKP